MLLNPSKMSRARLVLNPFMPPGCLVSKIFVKYLVSTYVLIAVKLHVCSELN